MAATKYRRFVRTIETLRSGVLYKLDLMWAGSTWQDPILGADGFFKERGSGWWRESASTMAEIVAKVDQETGAASSEEYLSHAPLGSEALVLYLGELRGPNRYGCYVAHVLYKTVDAWVMFNPLRPSANEKKYAITPFEKL